MIKCLLVDDEPLALSLLEDNLRHVQDITIAGRCRTAAEALHVMGTTQIDLLFCDIHMPGLNGLQLVKSLVHKPMVIFVTAYEKFAIESFELDVVDYLVKPVPLERFLKACYKVIQLHSLKKMAEAQQMPSKRHLFLYVEYALVKINLDDIEYIEGLKDYVKVHIAGREKALLSRSSIKALEQQLPPGRFYRVHRSYIVNVDFVAHIRRGRLKIGGAELPLSDTYRETISMMTGRVLSDSAHSALSSAL
jgi:DNA-binding LytR/AlgR family response regulator